MQLTVRVSDDFQLNAGSVVQLPEAVQIIPPEPAIFAQLIKWLSSRSNPNVGFDNWALGIGASALCVRWGTYLAVLFDHDKPVDPQAHKPHMSMISDGEMMRINIEASSNLAHLLQLWQVDEWYVLDLLRKAYAWLPMPQRRVRRNSAVYERVWGIMLQQFSDPLPHHIERGERAVAHPHRALANLVTVLAYRNGPIESIHGGILISHVLAHRRVSKRQEQQVIRYTAERLTGILAGYMPWANFWKPRLHWPQCVYDLPRHMFYPTNWSLTDSTCTVTLYQSEH